MRALTRRRFLQFIGQAGLAGLGSSLLPFDALAQMPWWEYQLSEDPNGDNGLKITDVFAPEAGILCEYPSVAVAPNGDAWMIWTSEGEAGESIKLAKFNGSNFDEARLMSDAESKHAYQVEILATEKSVIAVWASFEAIGRWIIHAAVMGSDGTLRTMQISDAPGISWKPAIVASSDGGAWIAWEEKTERHFQIKARKIDNNGNLSAISQVSQMADRDNCRPSVAPAPGGGVMLAWDRSDGPGNINIVHVTINSDGAPVNNELAVTQSVGLDICPAATVDANGQLWVAWHTNRWDDEPFDIPRWFQLRTLKDGVLYEPASPPPGMSNQERDTIQSFEFVGLYAAGGRVWVSGRASHMFYLQSFGPDGWSPLYRLSEFGWGGRGQFLKLATAKDGSFLTAQRDVQKNTLQKVEVTQPTSGNISDAPLKPVDQGSANLILDSPTPRVPMAPWNELNYYFGDIHGHTWMSDGVGDIDEYYMIRRDRYQLDFASLTDHDTFVGNSIMESEWEQMKEMTTHFNEPGRFVTLYGQEWTTGRPPRGDGHKCIYSTRPDIPLWDHLDERANSTEKINALAKEWGAIIIPHHTGWTGLNWDTFDPEVSPLIEIASVHGVFEYQGNKPIPHRGGMKGQFIQDGLARGFKFGIIGSNDCHGLIWHHRIAIKRDPYVCGWIGVLAPELTPEAIFEAMKKRRCFATTGVRIRMEFEISGAMMGDEIDLSELPSIRFDVTAVRESELKWIEVVRNNETILQYGGEGVNTRFTFADREAPEGTNFYYLRVICEDGNMAWSSPIWVNQKG